ncbi:MAG: hypothetical protein RL846_33765, partial [Deltaproteobacteria bacterium]
PLSIQEVRASYAAERIVFSARAAGAHALYVGSDRVGPPSYDLERILAQKDTLPLELGDASIGTLVDNPVFGQPSAEPLPWTEQHRGTIAIVLVVVLLGLAAWAVRLFVSRPA